MPTKPSLPLLNRLSPAAWAAFLWCAATLSSIRAQFGIPGMPQGVRLLDAGDWLLLAAAALLALTGCGRLSTRPLAALALLVTGSLGAALAVDSVGLAFLHHLALDIALGVIVATRPRRTWAPAFVLTVAALPGHALLRSLLGLPLRFPHSADTSWTSWETFTLLSVIACLAGLSVRRTREYARELTARAAAQAVTAERLRIAREMHDSVAHSIGIIALQAGAAARVVDTRPDAAREAMTVVELAGRETLAGLRRMLVALRQPEPADGQGLVPEPAAGPRRVPEPHADVRRDGPAPSRPAEGLADVERLAAATTGAGVRVDVRWHGERRPLPPDIDLSAFRIIQESVTNVVRHAATGSCRVSVGYGAEELAIEITDSGRGGGSSPESGFGLVGMRERVALLKGEFSAAPVPSGGFRVAVRLPVPAGAGR
ncbi:sensor histidine kinase [Streptomyces sp. NBC_00654]|uniref:sensor histidine kinase n=1 Tax=Streptomyces sp. NBC_00654 TaxID=2975799 RepID=UPI00224DE80E|nr:sensor histidine kinase [Streptomyces sp. NBC_00654]MCX4964603.1 sensor histidine kinase [Streptomyces sp. NBC_00654]